MNTVSKILAILPLLVVLLSVCSSCTTKEGKDADAQGSLPEKETNKIVSINSVAGHDERDTIVGNFTGKGIDTIYVYTECHYPEKNDYDQYTSYYAKSNNPELPTIELWGCDGASPKLVYEGDVDSNGKDEWGYLHTWMTSQWRTYRIYTLVGNEWRFLISPTDKILDTNETLRGSGLEVIEKGDKKGYVKVHYTCEGINGINDVIRDTIVAATYTKITKEIK